MSGRLLKYLSKYPLFKHFKDFLECVRQIEMDLSSLLLRVERAVKTYAELLLPFRASATFGLRMLSRSHQKSNFSETGISVFSDVEI